MFAKLFDQNKKLLKKIYPIVDKINSLEEKTKKLTHEQILEKTKVWKEELRSLGGKKQLERLDEMLPEVYAVVREASTRVFEMRPYDVQLIAGITLHQGKISEQKTGEGKTLTAVLPLYLNSLTGKGAHLVTPNDYLSRHGAGWMGPLYKYLGISVSVVMGDRSAFKFDPDYEGESFAGDEYTRRLKPCTPQEAYQCGVTYGTNHTFGFDYLRDNMAPRFEEMVQTNAIGEWGVHNFAIVDEVDSILIDVARTPLIISTTASKPTERYHQAVTIVKALIKDTDYDVDEKFKSATLTDLGIRRVERLLSVENLYEQDFEMVHLIEQSLAARALYEKDKDYVVKEGQVVIVDQFTGRLLPSNRYSQGLHQAIEAKEGVTIQQESRTLAEISYQNYFRMYKKLAGMTGTAATEAEEFYKIYGLEVLVIPTNKPLARIDSSDVVYKTMAAKFSAVAQEAADRHEKGQPVLIGTTSVEKSQLVHEQLKRRGISHEILNAKNHDKEALIIAQAGSKGAVTVSTNMAGRGVDIKLGGDPATPQSEQEVKDLGGLHVIGTERHDSRRIDNQLRGRSGRQGDAGSSRFFISLQDDLMRIFGGAQVERLMDKFGLEENVPIEAGLVSKAIANAQKRVEGFNFDRRKQVVEMDDVMNIHREVVYKLRRRVLELVQGSEEAKNWLINRLVKNSSFDTAIWEKHSEKIGEKVWLHIVSDLSRPVIDLMWMEHLVDMRHVRDGIGLRGYAQRDPTIEYKKEGHERFEILVRKMYVAIAERISNIGDIKVAPRQDSVSDDLSKAQFQHGKLESGVSDEAALAGEGSGAQMPDGRKIKVEAVNSGQEKVGRNDPCPCGKTKEDGTPVKYKHCHGKN